MKRPAAGEDGQNHGAFRLGDWWAQPELGRITRADESHRLEPRVIAVLAHLAQRQGEVVTREQLELEVWRGALVSYDAVTSTIVKLRRVLKDNPKQPHFIAAIPKRGYCLIASVAHRTMWNGNGNRADTDITVEPGDTQDAEPAIVATDGIRSSPHELRIADWTIDYRAHRMTDGRQEIKIGTQGVAGTRISVGAGGRNRFAQ